MTRDKESILDELLVVRAKRGDTNALGELVRRWEGRLFYFVRRLVGTEDDAWDVLQQTWLKVFRGIHKLQHADRLGVWLYANARSTAISHWRAHYRTQSRLEENCQLSELPADDERIRLDDAEAVHRALSRLSIEHREVLVLFFLEDMPLQQMAEILEVPLGTAKSRLFYAKRALADVLEREERRHA